MICRVVERAGQLAGFNEATTVTLVMVTLMTKGILRVLVVADQNDDDDA